MDTISRLPRRLTQLYSDTKTSCDAVVEQDAPNTQPEVHALHRKYRIQKDRLIAWGLEWSDNTKEKQGDIDESVARAGLTDNVTSVMGTIKEILDEAERMHPPVAAGAKTMSGEKPGTRPSDLSSWAASDRSRYEDLAKELTTSIDTLYNLSRRGRTFHDAAPKAVPDPPKAHSAAQVFLSSEYNASDVTLINPATFSSIAPEPAAARSNLPPKLDPSDLILPQEEPPPYESVGPTSSIRVIGRLRSRHSSTNPWKTDGSKTVESPVLVEYAAFDPAYRQTGVSPRLDRLDNLLSILARLANEQSFHGTLTCVGYFEDPKQPRFGLVFELPSFVYSGGADAQKPIEELRPVTLLNVLQTGSKSLHNSNSATPPLEDRFRLAFTLARTFSKIHGDDFVHKDVNSSNILVFRRNKRQSVNSRALQYALRSPVICSFDLFSDENLDLEPTNTMSPRNIYRHPEDPKATGEKNQEYGPQFDLYSLGLILLEIGLWQPLSDLWKVKYSLTDFKQRVEDVYIRRLASKCGTAYMQVVRDCFWAAESSGSNPETPSNFSQLYNRILIRLQRCCYLDESDPSFEWSGPSAGTGAGAAAFGGPLSLKRKSVSGFQAPDQPLSPSAHRSPKRYIYEKGSQVIQRTKSLSKRSPQHTPNLSLSRSESRSSQHSIRKSISSILSPKEEPTYVMDWGQTAHNTDPLAESGTLVESSATTPKLQDDAAQKETVEDAAGTMQRAWRDTHTDTDASSAKSMTLKDYKDKITLIQRAWRQRKETRNTIGALVGSSTHLTLGYPTPPPPEIEVRTIDHIASTDSFINTSIQIQTDMEPTKRAKLRLHPVKFPDSIVDEWSNNMLPRLERLLERALKDSDETVSIDLVAVGETLATARPTIMITCASIQKVKAVLARRFRYDNNMFDLKVRRGRIRRSKLNRPSRRTKLPHRSMINTDNNGDVQVMNPYHQQRPVCGASIGAFNGEHLPPVSFGGVILVDDEPLGMSVHHLLDAPSDDESDSDDEAMSPGPNEVMLSSATSTSNPWLMGMGSQPSVQTAPDSPMALWNLEISDDEDTKSDDGDYGSLDLSSDSDYDSDEEMASSVTSSRTTGDIEGIALGYGEEIKITQPAIDDVDSDFFPEEEDKDEDHLSSHELGYVHASSGIRRWKKDGIVHEIDWALLKLDKNRLQPYNLVQGGRRFCFNRTIEQDQQSISSKLEQPISRHHYRPEEDEYPNGVASAKSLGGLNVHCFGRTTGLQGGMVGAAMSSVRIYRRKTFSRSWHVAGGFGVGGDSGAWVIQNGTHQVIGHVLAWCDRNRIAYICPMEVLLEDIKRTLGARRIYLPGSVEEARYLSSSLKMITGKEGSTVEELELGVDGLNIIGAVPVGSGTSLLARRSRADAMPDTIMGIPRNGNAESDKENLPVLRSRLIKVTEGRKGVMEVVGVP
ncbi:hypothetical protein P154DRAFT_519611 [Amniculicola lignicola CBS 123094]|uniref:Protein kinase domain-containing protein n=1 Tax=Amniculicola lignicola CBS 123094 TaxID=1392246 RepID=A0A6A5WQ81_9PLEO|nr:hypothetical protein P154DRAFT_519611 [Amniculicola lignicola CBS 123094]